MHTTEGPKPQKPTSASTVAPQASIVTDGKEVFTTAALVSSLPSTPKPATPAPAPPPVIEEEDDLSIPVQPGTRCRRNGCMAEFVDEEKSRTGEDEGAICTYHPSSVSSALMSSFRLWRH